MFVGLFFNQKYCEFLFFCNFIENIKILILAKIWEKRTKPDVSLVGIITDFRRTLFPAIYIACHSDCGKRALEIFILLLM